MWKCGLAQLQTVCNMNSQSAGQYDTAWQLLLAIVDCVSIDELNSSGAMELVRQTRAILAGNLVNLFLLPLTTSIPFTLCQVDSLTLAYTRRRPHTPQTIIYAHTYIRYHLKWRKTVTMNMEIRPVTCSIHHYMMFGDD